MPLSRRRWRSLIVSLRYLTVYNYSYWYSHLLLASESPYHVSFGFQVRHITKTPLELNWPLQLSNLKNSAKKLTPLRRVAYQIILVCKSNIRTTRALV